MKNEIRPTKKDLDKRISEMQEKHGETFGSLKIFSQFHIHNIFASCVELNVNAQSWLVESKEVA